ncbi:MAG: hypothetical protein AAGI34_02700 [Pseudomonadota bacterium]
MRPALSLLALAASAFAFQAQAATFTFSGGEDVQVTAPPAVDTNPSVPVTTALAPFAGNGTNSVSLAGNATVGGPRSFVFVEFTTPGTITAEAGEVLTADLDFTLMADLNGPARFEYEFELFIDGSPIITDTDNRVFSIEDAVGEFVVNTSVSSAPLVADLTDADLTLGLIASAVFTDSGGFGPFSAITNFSIVVPQNSITLSGTANVPPIPLPAAFWLLATGVIALRAPRLLRK